MNAVVAVGYYGKIVARMWFEQPWQPEAEEDAAGSAFSSPATADAAATASDSDPRGLVSVSSAAQLVAPERKLMSLPAGLVLALGITLIATLLFGIVPGTLTHFTDVTLF